MKHIAWVTTLALMVVFAEPITAEPLPGADSSAAAAKAVSAAFVDDWNRHDMKSFAELFSEDAQFVNVIGLWWRSRLEIQKQHEALHATRMRHSHLVATETSVRLLRPDVAVLHFRWQLTGDSGIDGVTLPMRRGVMSLVMVQTRGKWQIASAQNTDAVPLPNVPP
jgi:uncharacterized protein (TIGR02246 family)